MASRGHIVGAVGPHSTPKGGTWGGKGAEPPKVMGKGPFPSKGKGPLDPKGAKRPLLCPLKGVLPLEPPYAMFQ